MNHEKWLRQAAREIRAEGHCGWGNTCEQAADHIAALEAELAAVKADAERYQWLRLHTDSMSVSPPLTVAIVEGWGLCAWSGDNLDAAIDKARGGE